MALFAGIDGGGSKTSCLIGDEHSLLGSAVTAGSNVVRVGETRAKQSLSDAIRQACSAAGVAASEIHRTCVGVAGAARAGVSEFVRRTIAGMVSGEVEVVGDMVITLEAAFGAGAGVVAIAGTGSIAYGRNSKGETARAGGWGFAVSDEGSGHWIGRSAVAAAFRARDRDGDKDEGRSTQLFESILNFWQLETEEQLVLAANRTPSPDFAALFPSVLAAAESGDALAVGVLTQAGAELAGLAQIVSQRIFREDETIPVAMSGGVFASSALVRQVFYNRLQASHPQVAVSEAVAEPVRGALALARRGEAQ